MNPKKELLWGLWVRARVYAFSLEFEVVDPVEFKWTELALATPGIYAP